MDKFLKFDLPKCPYCKMRLLYTESFVIKNRPTYKCLNCENTSEVFLPKALFKTLQIIQLISLIIFVFAVFKGSGFCLLGLIFITFIFGGFYSYAPFMIKLKPGKYDTDVVKNFDSMKEDVGQSSEKEIFSN